MMRETIITLIFYFILMVSMFMIKKRFTIKEVELK